MSTPRPATLSQQASALAYDLRQRINAQYVDQRGTESYERKECADMIDSLVASLQERDETIKDLRALLRTHQHFLQEAHDELNGKAAK